MSGAESLGNLDVSHGNGVSVITLANSKNGNPLNPGLLNGLHDALEQSFHHDKTRVIILRSNGKRFCIGMDFIALSEGMEVSTAGTVLRASIETYSGILAQMYEGNKPVICLVNGEVRAGGIGLVCASDMVFATQSTEFTLSEVLFGLIPANVLPYLLGLRVSPQRARYLILSSKTISAQDALTYGIVDEIHDAEQMEKATRTVVRQLLRSSPDALSRVKQFTGELLWNPVSELRDRAIDELIGAVESGDALTAIQAFQNGETPEWFSRYKPEEPLFLEEDV